MTASEKTNRTAKPDATNPTQTDTEATNATGTTASPPDGPQDFSDADSRPAVPPQGGNNNKKAPFSDIRVSVEQSVRQALNGNYYPLMTGTVVSWTINPDMPPPVRFECHRDGHILEEVDFDPKKTLHLAVDPYQLPDMEYKYQVFAIDAENNKYNKSAVLTHTTPSTAENHNLLTRVAGITIRFSDSQGPNVDTKAMQDLMFDGPLSMVKYFEEVSYGKVNITGDVYAEITLDYPLSKYQTIIDGKEYSYTNLLYDDIMEAIGKVFDLAEYDFLLAVVMGYERTSSLNETIIIEDLDFDLESIVHELGHSLGCSHASYWIGEGGYVGPSVVDIKDGGWQTSKYADVMEPMGASNHRQFSPINKNILGFIGPSQIKTIVAPGIYELFALATPTTGPVEFRLPFKTVNEKIFYTLEYRKPLGLFDSPPLEGSEGQSTGFIIGNGEPLHCVIIRLRWDPISANKEPSGDTNLLMPRTIINKEVEFSDTSRDITIKVIEYQEPHKVKLSIEGNWF